MTDSSSSGTRPQSNHGGSVNGDFARLADDQPGSGSPARAVAAGALPGSVRREHEAAVAAIQACLRRRPSRCEGQAGQAHFQPVPVPRSVPRPGPPSCDVSAFSRVLHVDPASRTAVVGGMTTYEDLADATLRHGLMPFVVPQLKTITLGGAVTGLGIESTSLRLGMPHESVLAMEILTGDGRVVTATADNEHADLFRGFPNSYGTLGYALSLTIELEPVAPFVHLRHFRVRRPRVAAWRPSRRSRAEGSYDGHRADFVDGAMFSLDEMYLTVGAFSDVAPWTQRLHRQPDLLPVAARSPGGLPHHPRLPVALGHRLVLVLPAVRGTEPDDPQALAAPLPEVRRVPLAGRLRPAARHLRPDPAKRRGEPPREDVHPGRRDPRRPRRRVPPVLRLRRRHEPGLAVPAPAAQ